MKKATNKQVIDYAAHMDKRAIVKMARQLGWKGDPERNGNSKEALIGIIRQSSMDDQRHALFALGWQGNEIDDMLVDEIAEASEPAPEPEPAPAAKKAAPKVVDAPAPELEPEPAKPAKGKADVNQLAAMFAQLMEVSRGQLGEDEIRAIAQQVAETETTTLAEALMETQNMMSDGFVALRADVDKLKVAVGDAPSRKIEVSSFNGTHTIEGVQHAQFEKLLRILGSRNAKGSTNLNLWIAGPSGAGKTTAAENAATALGMKFYTNGSIGNKYELTGFVDAHGNLQRTPFRDAWEHGGVYLFDEIDGSVPASVLAFNAALANGLMAFPDGMVRRNANCVIIAAANTMGGGATTQFLARFKQDKAFLNRFVKMTWRIDEALERAVIPKEFHEWVTFVQKVRKNCERKGVDVLITPRASVYGAQLLGSGLEIADVIELTMSCDMEPAQWNMVDPRTN